MKALATGIGENKTALMYLPNINASPMAGTDAINKLRTKRRDLELAVIERATLRSFSRNSQQTAKIAPN